MRREPDFILPVVAVSIAIYLARFYFSVTCTCPDYSVRQRFRRVATIRLMFTGIEHFAIASPNPKRLADWYVSHLEFEINFEYAGNYFIEAKNGGLIEIIPAEGERPASGLRTPGMRHVAITVDDFDAAYGQLQAQGVTFEGDPYRSGGNRLVFFSDADGNLVHLIKREKPLP